MRTVRRLSLMSLILSAVAAGVLMMGFRRPAAEIEAESVARTKHVRVAAAAEVEIRQPVRFAGVTRGAHSALASFTLGGRLETRPLEIGDRVRPGQTIATLDGREFRNSLRSTRASLTEIDARWSQARRDLERSQTLFAKDAATAEEVEKMRSTEEAVAAQRGSVAARVAELERLVAESTLRAPIAGTVSEVFLEPGEYAAPGRPVVALSGRDAIEIEVELPEAMIANLALDQPVVVEFPLITRDPVAGRITSLGTSTLGPGRLFPVTVTVDAAGLMPGITAEVVFERRFVAAGDALEVVVPVDALLDPGGQSPYLFAVRAGVARRLPVRVRRLVGEHAIVAGSVDIGDAVVVAGQFSLLDGDVVEIAEAAIRIAGMKAGVS